jgi:hypothetical protein
MTAPVLVHYHIYKNAGTSIAQLLHRCFGNFWTTFEGVSASDIIDSARLKDFLNAHPHIRAVSSHLARPPIPMLSVRPLLMLRHPIDRARSVYHFARRDPSQPDHAVARNGSFRDYVDFYLEQDDAGVVIRNYQVVHLSEASFRCEHIQLAEASPADLEHAKAVLAEWGVFGLVRRFADSCKLFSAYYGRDFPELVLQDTAENVSTSASLTDDQAAALACTELGEPTFDRLIEANSLDLALYRFAQARFSERLTALVN